MKSRSHRLPPSAPPDDWVDGSWTVDCSCGVTFDDGEEMVSCDECGVWVHTRCSRFVRGDASFACHNCKSSKKPSTDDAAAVAAGRDSEETEVAQLLIELPTKADPCPPPNPPPPAPPYRPPFRLWAEVPMEERVHVQGIPGGDPSLFQGLSSSVFTSELWRRAGYVPKKFNFQYREFPCWDEEGGENPASRGADVLFSLSKEIVPSRVPARALERKQEGEKVLFGGSRWVKKERNKLRVFGSQLSKKRREDSGEGKDRSTKKRARRDVDRVTGDLKRRGCVPMAGVMKAVNGWDGGLQAMDSVIPSDGKSEERKEDGRSEPSSSEHMEGMDKGDKASKEDEMVRPRNSLETDVKADKDDETEGIPSKIDESAVSCEEGNDAAKESTGGLDVSKAVHGLEQPKDESHFQGDLNEGSCCGVIDSKNSRNTADNHNVPDMHRLHNSDGAVSLSCKLYKVSEEIEGGGVQAAESTKSQPSSATKGYLHDVNQLPHWQQKSTGNSEIFQEQESVVNLSYDEHNSKNAAKEERSTYDKTTEAMGTEPKQHGQVVEESAGSSTGHGSSFQPGSRGHSSENFDESAKSEDQNVSHLTPHVHKSVAGDGKSSSTSSMPVITKPSVSSSYRTPGNTTSSTAGKASQSLTKQQRVKVATSNVGKKDSVVPVVRKEESMREASRHPAKGHSKGIDYFGSRSSLASRISHAAVSKHTLTDSKEQPIGPSSKVSTATETTISMGSDETAGSSQTENASVPIRQVPSGSLQRSEKMNPLTGQPPSKLLSHSTSMHPPASANATNTLSDEELALLLHQELNSSPRVPRVPRMRQATGMQSSAPTAASMLSKRSSSSGGKDQVSKRKNKEETSRDSFRNSHEVIDERKRMGRVSSSPDMSNREKASTADGSAKKDIQNRSPDSAVATKKNLSGASTDGENSCSPSFEASGQIALSTRCSSRVVPEDNTSLAHPTLPGLIDDIMGKGKCSTYEELCNAVRPHWHSLRKPNGERYAYATHSQAVLDCLRNRSEWAHLIDRGPKTNSSRRRRKVDSDTPTTDEIESEEPKDKASSREVEDKNEESYREDFPKGKRKARKRRRLELQGRGVMEAARKRHSSSQGSANMLDDYEDDDDPEVAFSHSTSDDEMQGARHGAAGADVSTSSSSGDTD